MVSTDSLFGHRSETPEQRLRRLVFPPTSPFQFVDPTQPPAATPAPGYAGYDGYPTSPYSAAAAAANPVAPYPSASYPPAACPTTAYPAAAAAAAPMPYHPFYPPTAGISPEDLFFLYKAGKRARRDEDPEAAWQRVSAAWHRCSRDREHAWWSRLLTAESERCRSEGRMDGWLGGAHWTQQILGAAMAGGRGAVPGAPGGWGVGGWGGGPGGGLGRRRVPFDFGPGRGLGRGPRGMFDDGDEDDEYDEDEDDDGEMDALFRAARPRGARTAPRRPPRGRPPRRRPGGLDRDDEPAFDRGRRDRGTAAAPRRPSFSRRRASPAAEARARPPAFGRRRDPARDEDEPDLDDEWERITPGMFGAGRFGVGAEPPRRRGERRDEGGAAREGGLEEDVGDLGAGIDFGRYGLGAGRERRRSSE